MQKIIVQVDFFNGTDLIIEQAQKIAKAFSSSIYLVYVAPSIQDSSGRDNGVAIEEMRNDYPDEVKELNRLAKKIRHEGLETHAVFIEGVVALSIIELSQKVNAELIVMGTHEHASIIDLLLGKISQAVVNRSLCPVLLVPIKRLSFKEQE